MPINSNDVDDGLFEAALQEATQQLLKSDQKTNCSDSCKSSSSTNATNCSANTKKSMSMDAIDQIQQQLQTSSLQSKQPTPDSLEDLLSASFASIRNNSNGNSDFDSDGLLRAAAMLASTQSTDTKSPKQKTTTGNGATEDTDDGLTDADIDAFVDGLVSNLTSKEVLYEPLKELHDKYAPWLALHGQHGRDSSDSNDSRNSDSNDSRNSDSNDRGSIDIKSKNDSNSDSNESKCSNASKNIDNSNSKSKKDSNNGKSSLSKKYSPEDLKRFEQQHQLLTQILAYYDSQDNKESKNTGKSTESSSTDSANYLTDLLEQLQALGDPPAEFCL